ncbi:MAG: AbgT family transporter [Firmicutes bacterium]|nr:AbgT family transporter [Bacillota bacterium]MDY5856880.1 hypothetical protein [Anaerovoracaceae bacterium]
MTEKNEKNQKKVKRGSSAVKGLNPMIIILCIVIFAAIATYILPAGSFERVTDEVSGAEVVVPDTYTQAERNPIGFMDFLMSITKGMQSAGSVVFFLLIVGGVFEIIQCTGAIQAGIGNLVKRLGNRQMLMIPLCIIVFSIISTTAACCEEYLAFLPLMYAACIACGFDSIIALMLLFGSSAIGYAAGVANPFTTGIAQEIAGLPPFSGLQLRVVLLIVLNIVTIVFVMLYARKIKKDPALSPMHEIDLANAQPISMDEVKPLTGRQAGVLAVFLGGFVMIAVLVILKGYYMDELSALFLIMGIVSAIIGGVGPSRACDAFIEGAKGMLFAGMMVGFCRAATNIMTDANVFDTIINAFGSLLEGLDQRVAACGMFVVQDLFNILVPSGSGQAAITMPFMAPLSDLLGVSRQTAVLAFHLGDAFTNVVTPTSGAFMAALAMCKVPWGKWVKWIAPLWGIWCVIAFIFLVIAVSIGYGPF